MRWAAQSEQARGIRGPFNSHVLGDRAARHACERKGCRRACRVVCTGPTHPWRDGSRHVAGNGVGAHCRRLTAALGRRAASSKQGRARPIFTSSGAGERHVRPVNVTVGICAWTNMPIVTVTRRPGHWSRRRWCWVDAAHACCRCLGSCSSPPRRRVSLNSRRTHAP